MYGVFSQNIPAFEGNSWNFPNLGFLAHKIRSNKYRYKVVTRHRILSCVLVSSQRPLVWSIALVEKLELSEERNNYRAY